MNELNASLSGIQQSISVMLAASDPVLISNLESFLESQRQIRLVGIVNHNYECLDKLPGWEPDVLLLQEGLDDIAAYDICRTIKEKNPRTAVCMMVGQSDYEDADYHRHMMSVHCSYIFAITETPSFMDWLHPIQNAVELLRTVPQGGKLDSGKVFAIHSLKGGVGRTVIAANLALALSQSNGQSNQPPSSVLVVDLNWPFGGIETYLNITPIRSILDLLPVMDSLTQQRILDATSGSLSNLHVLTVPLADEQTDFLRDLLEEDLQHTDSGLTDELLSNVINARLTIGASQQDEKRRNTMEYILRKAKAKEALLTLTRQLMLTAPRYFDYIVFDLPSVIDELTLSVMRRADRVIQVCTPDVPSVRALRAALTTLPQFNVRDERFHLLLNRTTKADEIKRDDVKALFSDWNWLSQMPEDPRLATLINTSNSPMIQAPKGIFGSSMTKIAEELLATLTMKRSEIALGAPAGASS